MDELYGREGTHGDWALGAGASFPPKVKPESEKFQNMLIVKFEVSGLYTVRDTRVGAAQIDQSQEDT